MTTDRATAIAVGVLGVAVLATLAGAFGPATAGTGDGESGGQAAVGTGGGVGSAVGLPGWLVGHTFQVVIGFWTIVSLLGAVAIVRSQGIEGLERIYVLIRDGVVGTALVVLFFGVLVFVGFDVFSDGIDVAPSGPAPDGGGGPQAEAAEGIAAGGAVPPWAIVGAVLFVVAAALVIRRLYREPSPDGQMPTVDYEPPDGDLTAGTDRDHDAVADVEPTNEVYRAWLDVADRVGFDHEETATASDVEAAAVDRGLDRSPVARLRRTFEEVRYGDRAPTGERRRRAKRALDEIDAPEEGDA